MSPFLPLFLSVIILNRKQDVTEKVQDPTTTFPGKKGEPARLILLRHGASGGSAEGLLIGRTDVDLLPPGEAQVRGAAKRAVRWLNGAAGISMVSSPLLRARRSAEIFRAEISRAKGPGPGPGGAVVRETRIIDGLSELDLGDWEEETYEGLMERDPERMHRYFDNFLTSKSPGGESLSDLAARVRPAVEGLRIEGAGRVTVVTAHAAVNRVIVCDSLGTPLDNFFRVELSLGSLCVIDYHGEVPLVRLVNG